MIKFTIATILIIGLISSAVGQYEEHVDRGFTARRAALNGNYIGFDKLIQDTNVGTNYFNKQYGFFRVEKGGLHHFSFQFMSSYSEHFRVSLRVNGRAQVWAQAQRKHIQAGNSVTMSLQKGDIVYLYLDEGNIFEPANSYRGYGTFTGHRLTYDETEPVVPRVASRISKEEKKEIDNYQSKLLSSWN